MRVRSLDISGYGRLATRTLDGFAPFTVVHGPNEAGKSTLRRLLRDLLFGFPAGSARKHPYAFSRAMEARASVALADGRDLTLHRKRSTQEFLRIEPSEFGNDAWKALLGGMDDDLYGRMLCCSAQEMSDTAKALREGSFLETLRADATGGLRGAKALLADADTAVARFRTGQGHRRLRGDLDKAKAELAEVAVGWDDAGRKSSRLRELEERVATLQERLTALDGEIRLRERAGELAAVREAAADLEERLARQGAPATFPPRARERADDLASERARLCADLKHLEEERLATRDAVASLPPPDPILAAPHEALEPLQGRRDGIAALLRTLPGLHDRMRTARLRLDDAIAALFPDASASAPATAQGSLFDTPATPPGAHGRIPDAATARELARLREVWREAESAAAQARRDLERDRETLEGLAPPDDLTERERALANLWYGESKVVEASRTALEDARRREHGAERALARLEPRLALAGLPPLEALLRIQLPQRDDAERLATRWREAAQTLEAVERRLETVERELGELGRSSEDGIATVERRDQRRARRDRLWEAAKARIEGAPDAGASTLLEPGQTLVGAFEASLRDADADADALLAQGERIRRAAALRTERESLLAERARGQESLAAEQRHWDALWASSGIQPGSDPVSGLAWLETRLEAQEPWIDLEDARRASSQARAVLDAFTERVRLALELPVLAFENALTAANAAYERARLQKQARQAFDRENARLREGVERAAGQAAALDSRAAECATIWSDTWNTAFPGSTSQPPPDARLELLGRLVESRDAFEAAATALENAERERDTAAHAVAPVLHALGLSGGAEHLGMLLDRRRSALETRTRREQDEIRLHGAEQRIAQRQDDLRRLDEQFLSLWREAGASDEPSFLALLAAHEAAAPLRIELDACRRKLDAATPDDLRRCAEHPSSRWAELLAESRAAAATAGEERDRLLHDKGALESDLAAMARRNDEPLSRRTALLQASDALNDDARAHLRARIVRLALQRACDAFASRHTPPLQAWSGQYLSTITGGRWDSIDLSQEDRLAVASLVRDETLDESALSTGTADQVRLALRMAVARQWAATHEPLPFLLDDVLVATDPERAARALEALRELSADAQVIYFTCHASIADAAGKLGAAVVGI